MKITHKIFASATVLTLAAVGIAPGLAGAQDNGDTPFDVSLTPLIREVNVDPGENVTGSVEITNNADGTLTIYPKVRDFSASTDPDTGSPNFSEVSIDGDQSISQWVGFSVTSVEIAPGATQAIDYTMEVPANAEAGGHYGAIIASSVPGSTSEGETGVAVSGEVGSLLMVSVSGDIRSSGEVLDFATDQSMYTSGPVDFQASLRNSGNVHFKPVGSIDIDGPVKASITVNEDGGNVLPNSVRNFTASWDDDLPFGRYTASLKLTAETPDGGSVPLTAVATFWVVPMSTILVTLLILIVLYLLMKSWAKPSSGSKK